MIGMRKFEAMKKEEKTKENQHLIEM